MRIKVRLFARLRDVVGTAELEREVPPQCTVAGAWDDLAAQFPAVTRYRGSVSAAVNEEFARMSATLSEGDEVAFLPPVSGG